jgi:hypothetical protein
VAPQRTLRTVSGPRDTVVTIYPPNFLFALTVTGTKSAEKGLGVTLDKLGMPREELAGRLEVLGPAEAFRGPRPGVWAAFAATCKDGQRGLIWMALKELKALAGGGLEKDAEGIDGSRAAYAAFLPMRCVVLSRSSL